MFSLKVSGGLRASIVNYLKFLCRKIKILSVFFLCFCALFFFVLQCVGFLCLHDSIAVCNDLVKTVINPLSYQELLLPHFTSSLVTVCHEPVRTCMSADAIIVHGGVQPQGANSSCDYTICFITERLAAHNVYEMTHITIL